MRQGSAIQNLNVRDTPENERSVVSPRNKRFITTTGAQRAVVAAKLIIAGKVNVRS
jgi:hypothetical protein